MRPHRLETRRCRGRKCPPRRPGERGCRKGFVEAAMHSGHLSPPGKGSVAWPPQVGLKSGRLPKLLTNGSLGLPPPPIASPVAFTINFHRVPGGTAKQPALLQVVMPSLPDDLCAVFLPVHNFRLYRGRATGVDLL